MTVVGVLVMLGVGCVTMLSVSCTSYSTVSSSLPFSTSFFGLKVRESGLVASSTERANLIAFCVEYGINRLLIEPEWVSGSGGDTSVLSVGYPEELASLISDASEEGIVVEALESQIDLVDEPGFDRPLSALSAIASFNRTLPVGKRLVGIHYEIKPHLLPQWEGSGRSEIMREHLDFLEVVKIRLAQSRSGLRVSASMPYWYDNRISDEDSCLVDFYGSTKNFQEHIQDLTDYVSVTCDRQEGESSGRLEDLIDGELDYADWANRGVCMEIETARRVQSTGVSFYGRPAWEFWQQRQEVEKALDFQRGFQGVMVNHYRSFEQLMSHQRVVSDEEASRGVGQTFGMWVWHEKWISSEAAQDEVLAFCKKHGINLLHVQMHFDPGSLKRGEPELKYPELLRRFVDRASYLGVKVEALDGAAEMALAVNRASVLATVDTILAFNKTLPHGVSLSGIHFDVEPYLLPEWKTSDRHAVMYQNLELYEAVALKLKLDAPNLTLSASIPFWYDERTTPDDSCILEYGGQRKNFHEHIQDLTDYVVIMSYRREAIGEDSIAKHIEVERAYAEWTGKVVCAGMETLEIEERPEVSFHGLPPAEFWFQREKLEGALSHQGGYRGVVVHSYETFAPYLAGEQAN